MVFLGVLLFIKLRSEYQKNHPRSAEEQKTNGLVYQGEKLGDLVNKDTDGDEIPDWQESLWGTDPTKKETTPGIPDAVTIEKLKANQQLTLPNVQDNTTTLNTSTQSTTKTSQFSEQLFSSIAALNQNGEVDQNTVDQIGGSLSDSIKNTPQRKIYALADLKIVKSDTLQAIKKYGNDLDGTQPKNPVKYTVLDVLQKFAPDEDTVNESALSELDPIIKQTDNMISAMLKVSVPESFSSMHLDAINALEKVSENVTDIQLYTSDPIVSFSAMGQYDQNIETVLSAFIKLSDELGKRLSN